MGETALPVVVPHLYLDTMIMVDTLFDRVRGDDSIELVEAIRNRRWYCSTSNFAVMELLDQWQEEQWVEDQRREGLQFRAIYRGLPSRRTDPNKLKRIYDQIMRRLEIRYPFIRYAYPNDAGWAEAARICGITEIDASDCIHIVTAREAGCDLFVTKDADLIGRLSSQLPNYIQVARPDEVDQKLRGLGFRW